LVLENTQGQSLHKTFYEAEIDEELFIILKEKYPALFEVKGVSSQ
jgi:hypothetical protein